MVKADESDELGKHAQAHQELVDVREQRRNKRYLSPRKATRLHRKGWNKQDHFTKKDNEFEDGWCKQDLFTKKDNKFEGVVAQTLSFTKKENTFGRKMDQSKNRWMF